MSAPRPPSLPRPPRPPSLQHKAPGAPPAPRSAEITQESLRPYPADLSRWPAGGSHLENICHWWLIAKRGYVPNQDYLIQAAVGTAGAIGGPTNTKSFLRVDILLLPQGRHGGLGYPYQRGLIWNPISPFTHPSIGKDRLERNVLATLGYRVVYIDGDDLETRPDFVLRLALAGTDISSHRA
jgi:hypothetical protein